MRRVLFGAQGIALGTYKALRTIDPGFDMPCFLVTKLGGINAATLAGLPVRELEEFAEGMSDEDKTETQILICTPENVMGQVEESLESFGFSNHLRIDSVFFADYMRQMFEINREYLPVSVFESGSRKPDIEVYMAKFWKDQVLAGHADIPKYMIPIQAGAALTEKRVADVLDNMGDNISEKNVNYSELTALYWVWKNRLKDDAKSYVGLAHYRRFLMLSDEELTKITENDIDVVLPYPMPYEPNIHVHHERYLSEVEWNAVLKALEELSPEYAERFPHVLDGEYLYNYNIILAKQTVLNEYCSWLFPILLRVEELCDPDGTKQPNRYIGYVGETLETLYFMSNLKGLRIAHTGCRFLV